MRFEIFYLRETNKYYPNRTLKLNRLIAVNYEARKFGVKRGMRGEEAKSLCPEFHTFYVQEKRGKADLTKYREASMKIFDILVKHCQNVEKASIDEAYIDLTELVIDQIRNRRFEKVDLKDSYVVGCYTAEQGFF
jgi:DNA polymerase eta